MRRVQEHSWDRAKEGYLEEEQFHRKDAGLSREQSGGTSTRKEQEEPYSREQFSKNIFGNSAGVHLRELS